MLISLLSLDNVIKSSNAANITTVKKALCAVEHSMSDIRQAGVELHQPLVVVKHPVNRLEMLSARMSMIYPIPP